MKRRSGTRGNKQRRAVGAIIGGVILAAIMVTTVLVYFLTILNNEKAKTSYELQAAQANQEQAAEKMLIIRDTVLAANYIPIRIDNEGPQPLIISKVLLYCISAGCVNPEPAIESPSLTLNPGDFDSRQVGPVADGLTYRIDVISERGNIVSAKECKVNIGSGICENDPGDEEDPIPPCIDCAVNEGIIQGTGSLQLDFNAFGVILPEMASRTDSSGVVVGQKGWEVVKGSRYSNATGYPGFDIPPGFRAVLVEKMRNLDQAGNGIKLDRNTGLQILSGVQGSERDSVFICNVTGTTINAYNENTNPTILAWTPVNADRTINWREVYFCTTVPATSNVANPWQPNTNKFNNLNGIYMLARGAFLNSNAEYAQTVPYQAVGLGSTTSFHACLWDSDINRICPLPKVAQPAGDLAFAKYSSPLATVIGPGETVYAHLASTTTQPYTVTWYYPDGNSTIIFSGNVNANGNLQIDIPATMTDPNDPIEKGYYTIAIADSYGAWIPSDKRYEKNIWYITFQVT